MKRHRVKSISLVVCALVALCAWADVASPPPSAMSYCEWLFEMRQHSVLWRLSVPCAVSAAFLVVLARSLRRRSPTIFTWMACCVPVAFLIPAPSFALFAELLLYILGISALSWIISVVAYFRMRKFVKAVCLLFLAPMNFIALFCASLGIGPGLYSGGSIATEPHETYKEYQMRAKRIIHHHCSRCDKPMKEYGENGSGYWLCPDCDHGAIACSKCGANKDLVRKGLHRQEGYKWQCPNCDKATTR